MASAQLPPDRLVWLVLGTPSVDLPRSFQKYGAAISSLAPESKAYLCRFLVARALEGGAVVHDSALQVGLQNVRAGGVAVPLGTPAHAGGAHASGAIPPEASVVANVLLSTNGLALTQLKRLIDHPVPVAAPSASGGGAPGDKDGTGGGAPSSSSAGTEALPPLPAGAHVDMVTLLALLPGPTAAHVLHHVHVEGRRVAGQSAWHWPTKVYCDFDDTVQAKLFDRSFPSGATYPGFVPLIKALRGELASLASPPPPPQVRRQGVPGVGEVRPPLPPVPGDDARVGVHSGEEDVSSTLPSLQSTPASLPLPSGGGGHSKGGPTPSSGQLPHVMPMRSGFAGRTRLMLVSDIAFVGTGVIPSGRGDVTRRHSGGGGEGPKRASSSSREGSPSLPPPHDGPHAGPTIGLPPVHTHRTGGDPSADLVFLSARPAFMRGQTLSVARSLGLSHAAVLCGTLAMAINHSRLAARKLRNHLLHHALYPEFRVLFIGDTGQADVRFARLMLQAHAVMYGGGDGGGSGGGAGAVEDASKSPARPSPPPLPPVPLPGADLDAAHEEEEEGGEGALTFARGIAEITRGGGAQVTLEGETTGSAAPPPPLVLIHDICGADQQPLTSSLQRARLRAASVHVFDSYVEAALVAAQAGMLDHAALYAVVDATTSDLAGMTFGPANEVQRVMRLQEFTMAVRRCQQCAGEG